MKGKDTLQVTIDSTAQGSPDNYKDKAKAQKELVEKLKAQWNLLWNERFSDKVRAEDVSVNDYTYLSVERGTIIHANKDFKALAFRDILEQHMISESDRFVQPNAHSGGWNKFVRTKIINLTPQKNKQPTSAVCNKQTAQHPKKGGRGWLHIT